jgi:hypothetical protein
MMFELETINESAHAYLARIPKPKWVRIFDPPLKLKQIEAQETCVTSGLSAI